MSVKRLVDGEWDLHPDASPRDLAVKAPKVSYPPTLIDSKPYYSREAMEREWEQLWTKIWAVAGRVSDLAKVGDYFTYELGRETFIVVRASETEIKAFYNTCVHRGNSLVSRDTGHVSSFICGFHSWQYDLHGQLVKVTDEELFPKELICNRPGLREVRVGTWGGFIFITMDDDTEDLMSFLGIIPEHLAGYHLDDFYVYSDIQMEWDANWKTAFDGFVELYHSHAIHPQARSIWEDKYVQYDCYPKGHSRMLVPWGVVSSRLPVPEELPQPLKDQLKLFDVDPEKYSGPGGDIREALVAAKRRFAEKYNLKYYSDLTDDQLREAWSYSVFPNWTVNVQDNVLMFQSWRPHRSDPEKLIYNVMMLFPRIAAPNRSSFNVSERESTEMAAPQSAESASVLASEVADPTARPFRKYTQNGADLGIVLNQDYQQAPRQQRGLRSRSFAGMRFGGEEVRIRHYQAEIDTYFARGEKKRET
jgi:phenylpropionate dioxygenase-like ring-hydroxylating dioxygenase large terminal subunit